MSPSQIGPYRILRLLGEGGMGGVYEGIDESIGRRVAIKVLWPQFAKQQDALVRFLNEARAVNLIEHPSIVQVSEFGKGPDGTAYMVMECLRGEPLSARLARLHGAGQRLRVIEATQIAAQIADALVAAHSKEIIHRDLKPGNVMLVPDPVAPGGERVKILDFGIAKLAHGQGLGTATNAVMGTPQYMSPEQCYGARGVDAKTDVYALGIMLYEMLAGRPPFIGETPLEYMGQHAFQPSPDLHEFAPSVPSELYDLVNSLLVKDKTIRPAMRDVGVQLVNFAAKLSESAPIVAWPAISASDASVTPAKASPGAHSTLGGSLGQTQRPAAHRLTRLRIMLASVCGATLLTCAIGIIRLWPGKPATSSSAQTASPPLLPTLPLPPAPAPTVASPLSPSTPPELPAPPTNVLKLKPPAPVGSGSVAHGERGRTSKSSASPPTRNSLGSRPQPTRPVLPAGPMKRKEAYED